MRAALRTGPGHLLLPALLALGPTLTGGGGGAQEVPARIDFETWPDGSPACERCPISERFRDRGVVFDFFSRLTGRVDAYLIGSGAYDPEGEEGNHAVTSALTAEGFRPGVLTLSFPDGPRRVAFRLRGPDAVGRFVVTGFGPEGSPLPEGSTTRSARGTYRAAGGGRFREERISVESASGVSRIELDGRGPPGHILLVDDLVLSPATRERAETRREARGRRGTGITGAERSRWRAAGRIERPSRP